MTQIEPFLNTRFSREEIIGQQYHSEGFDVLKDGIMKGPPKNYLYCTAHIGTFSMFDLKVGMK